MNKFFIIVCVLFLIIFSCRNSNNESSVHIDEFKDFLSIYSRTVEDYNQIIIMPNLGCRPCNQAAMNYFYANVDDDSLLMIVTKIEDLKLLKSTQFSNYLNNRNLIIDSLNLASKLKFSLFYPSYVKFEEKYVELEIL